MICSAAKRDASPLRWAVAFLLGFIAAAIALTVFVVVTAAHQHRSPWGAWYVLAEMVFNGLVVRAVKSVLMRREQWRVPGDATVTGR